MAARRGEKHSPSIDRQPLTRAGVGAVLGVSVRRVRDLEKAQALKARVDGKGVHIFSRAEVEAYARLRGAAAAAKPRTDSESELAARIFDELEANADRVTIVTKLRAHPDTVNDVADKWEKMKARAATGPAPECARPGCGALARFCGECARNAAPVEPHRPSQLEREDRRPRAVPAPSR